MFHISIESKYAGMARIGQLNRISPDENIGRALDDRWQCFGLVVKEVDLAF